MRFLTPEEHRLLGSLPEGESGVLRAFFEECDARLVTGGDGYRSAVSDAHADVRRLEVTNPTPPVTSQDALFPMRKEARP